MGQGKQRTAEAQPEVEVAHRGHHRQAQHNLQGAGAGQQRSGGACGAVSGWQRRWLSGTSVASIAAMHVNTCLQHLYIA